MSQRKRQKTNSAWTLFVHGFNQAKVERKQRKKYMAKHPKRLFPFSLWLTTKQANSYYELLNGSIQLALDNLKQKDRGNTWKSYWKKRLNFAKFCLHEFHEQEALNNNNNNQD